MTSTEVCVDQHVLNSLCNWNMTEMFVRNVSEVSRIEGSYDKLLKLVRYR